MPTRIKASHWSLFSRNFREHGPKIRENCFYLSYDSEYDPQRAACHSGRPRLAEVDSRDSDFAVASAATTITFRGRNDQISLRRE